MARRERRRGENLSIRDHESVRRQIERDRGRGNPSHTLRPQATSEDPETVLARISLALVLLRVFLGVTFVYAGLDKLIDPTFLRSDGPGSIAAQLTAFSRASPLAVLIDIFARPFPILTGLVISIAEIAVGLGTLTGLLFRVSVVGGALLSILFWLTASWATTPYFYGPDLPYAAAWLTLAIAGDGGRFVINGWLARMFDFDDPHEPYDEAWSIERRHLLEGGLIGLGALALAAFGGLFGSSIFGAWQSTGTGSSPEPTAEADQGSAGPGTAQSSASSPIGAAIGTPTGIVVGTLAKLSQQGSLTFQDPRTGDPGVLLKLSNGTFVAYDAVCTHAGCTVEFDPSQRVLACPCHGATFDPAHHGAVLGGPTNIPLTQLPIAIDAKTGVVRLEG